MANQYTPDEIQDIFDRYHKAISDGIPITKAMAEELADAKKGIKNYTFTLNQSLKQLGQTTKKTIGDIANGAKGVSVFNDSLTSAADAASNVAMGFGPLGVAVGLVVKALTFFVTTANKQSDKLFETFQNISRSGAVGAQGMTDVFQSMKRFGYTIDELDKMTAVLAENSRDFALFSGTAATGGKQLSQLVDGFKDARVNLQALGLSTDEQVRRTAAYYAQMGRLGRATDATSAGAVEYIKKMEIMTRLTGLQAKDLEAARDQSEQIDAFYAALDEMDPKAAANAREVFDRLYAISPKKAAGFAQSLNGIITGSEEQMQLMYGTNFQALELGKQLREGQINASQYLQASGEAIKGNYDLAKEQAKIGLSDMFGPLREMKIIGQKSVEGFGTAAGNATKEMNDLYNMMDPATAAQAKARVAQINASNSMQSFVNLGVSPATQALATLADVVENLTRLIPGGGPENAGYGKKGTGSGGKAIASAATGAAAGAVAGSLLGPVGTAVGGIAGGLAGAAGYNIFGGTNSTTGKSLGDLNGDFKDKLLKATDEYYQLTGSKVNVTSAMRSREKQQELWDNRANSPYPVAPPGSSRHESGRAVDIDLDTANKMDSMGLLKKYGLSRPVAGDPIHIQGAAGYNGMLSGPMSGYKPNITMHGTEELSVRPMGTGTGSSNATASEGTMVKLIELVDDLIQINRNQLSTSERMLKYQQ